MIYVKISTIFPLDVATEAGLILPNSVLVFNHFIACRKRFDFNTMHQNQKIYEKLPYQFWAKLFKGLCCYLGSNSILMSGETNYLRLGVGVQILKFTFFK
jgi:hypothetical protein